jgi:hypothetical protein
VIFFVWDGDARFVRATTTDNYDLRVGVLDDKQSFGWLVYRQTENELTRIGWGTAPTMRYAQKQAEVFVENHRERRAAWKAMVANEQERVTRKSKRKAVRQ